MTIYTDQKKAETLDDGEMGTVWLDDLNDVTQYVKNRQKILNTLLEIEKMWCRGLGHIEIAKHCIDLTAPDVRTINAVSYGARPKPHELKKD